MRGNLRTAPFTMSKHTLRNKSCNVPAKQGKILSFVKPQSAADLLKSKDGLKQGRIEAFMQKKRRCDESEVSRNLPQSKKRQSGLIAVPETRPKLQKRSPSASSLVKRRLSPRLNKKNIHAAVLDLTGENVEVSEKAKEKARKNLSCKLKSSAFNPSSGQEDDKEKFNNDNEQDSSEAGDGCSENRKEESERCTMPQVTPVTKESLDSATEEKKTNPSCAAPSSKTAKNTSVPSVDDLCLDDSFLNAALDGMSPMKDDPDKSLDGESRILPTLIPCPSTSHSLAKFRFQVLNQSDSCTPENFPTKILQLENVATRSKVTCELHDGWADSEILNSDVINLIAPESELASGKVKVDSKQNLVVIQPDVLLSGTTVSNAIGCKRRAVLNERFKNTESGISGKPIMLIGTIVHTLFQSMALSRQKLTADEVLTLIRREIAKPAILKDILALGTTQGEVLNGVREFVPQLLSWIGEFVRDAPTVGVGQLEIKLPPGYKNEHACLDAGNGKSTFSANVSLSEVKDIEENVWSPLYGLKGKIDLTGGFLVRRHTNGTRSHCTKLTLPLELKTGRESHSTEHHAQVAIYSMFCKRRRDSNNSDEGTLPAGLLLYLKTGSLSCIPLKREDERELTMIRNHVASYLTHTIMQRGSSSTYEPSPFPPTVDNERFCSSCSQLRNCSLVYKCIDKNLATYNPAKTMRGLMEEQSAHLNAEDVRYFNHWVTCGLLETRKSMKNDLSQYYWLRSPRERQEAGSCATDLVLAGQGKPNKDGATSLKTFKRSAHVDARRGFDIFSEGESVVISGKEPEYIAMATGTVFNVSDNFLTLVTDRLFDGYPKNMRYSADKHEWPSVNSFNASFHNLSVIMQSAPHAECLRNLIVHHREPTFNTDLQDVIPRSSKQDVAKMLRGLNRTQRQAIKRVLLSNDYTLVVGMPGSGKTTTIVAMVRILLLCGCRVLVTSYTHSAIDNLLMKLVKHKVKFLRLGRTSQIHPYVRKFAEEELCKNITTPQELDALYSEAKVVGCTCLAVTSHALFASSGDKPEKRSRFDVCIVDEASQISQPACLAPLLHADRFVLVGDHRQLPPLVRSRKAKAIGADESLFWRLSHHKVALCDLTLQYRMNKTIMDVSNYVTYEGRLECATESVATARVKLPSLKTTAVNENKMAETNSPLTLSPAVISTCLDPEKPVVFLDTSDSKAYEEEIENGICNRTEADIVKVIIDYFVQAGCDPDSIGVIAPFRKQLKVIQGCLSTIPKSEKVEINTVDKYQGRDKSVILMSFVRSRPQELGDKAGELLSDWRRLNVALTRAKHKLILVGCRRTLCAYEPCKKLLTYLADNGMIITI